MSARSTTACRRFFAAGFYYKTFMWPKAAWKRVYEPKIRAAAGLGVAPERADPDHYASRFAHCDVLVIGGGVGRPVGRAGGGGDRREASSCATSSRKPAAALHLETDATIEGAAGYDWAQATAARLAAMENVRVLTRTTAFGYYAQNIVALAERVTDHLPIRTRTMPRERLWQVRAKRVVMATGAIERHMVFADNDRPGIMLASAARTYLNHYGVAVGSQGRRLHGLRFGLSRRLRPEAGRGRDRGDRRYRATIRARRLMTTAADLGIEVLTGHAVTNSRRLRSGCRRCRCVRSAATRRA